MFVLRRVDKFWQTEQIYAWTGYNQIAMNTLPYSKIKHSDQILQVTWLSALY